MRLALKPRGRHAAVEYQPGSRLSKAQLTQGDHTPRVRSPPTSLISDDQTWFSLFVQEAPHSSPSPSRCRLDKVWKCAPHSHWPLGTTCSSHDLLCQGLDASVQSAQLENMVDLHSACNAWTGGGEQHLGAHPDTGCAQLFVGSRELLL